MLHMASSTDLKDVSIQSHVLYQKVVKLFRIWTFFAQLNIVNPQKSVK